MKGCLTKLFQAVLALIVLALIGWAAYRWVIGPWVVRWGATDAEVAATLPGDELVPHSYAAIPTRAITIQASPAEIWPWLVQIGADKGGMYSYTWIENLIQCPQVNADRIHPEWQDLQGGDLMRMCPEGSGPPPYLVADIQPERALILGHRAGSEADRAKYGEWAETWSFVLEPIDDHSTRLIVRNRNALDKAWVSIIQPGFFIMERGMLIGIRDRAEGRDGFTRFTPAAELSQ